MIVTIVAVGRIKEPYLREGCAEYRKRLRPFFPVDVVELRDPKPGDADDVLGDAMLARAGPQATLWALDIEGTAIDSVELARRIAAVASTGSRRLVLAIGGADGLPRAVVRRADFRWSLSPLTFLHDMTRLIVFEQLYRAAKIERGAPYHR